MYYVIHSKDPYLLARLCVLLQMAGIPSDENWNDSHHPFRNGYSWMAVFNQFEGVKYFNFHSHNCAQPTSRLWATESNYIEVLEEILNNR